MKKLATIVIAALLVTACLLGGCSSDTQQDSQPASSPPAEAVSSGTGNEPPQPAPKKVSDPDNISVAYIHSDASIQASVSTEESILRALEERGLNWKIDIVDAFGDTSNLASSIENAVAKGVDAIVIDYADLRSTTSSLQIAAEAGIPVITIDAGGYVETTLCDITMNNYENAGKLSTYVINRIGSIGNVIIFDLDISAGVRQRCSVFRTVLAENSGIKILEDYNVDVTKIQQDTMDAMETFIQKYGIENIDAVYCGWDEAAYAVSQVLREAGYTADDCFVVGLDGHWDVSLGYMQKDKTWPQQATVVQAFNAYGDIVVDLIYKVCVLGQSGPEALNNKLNIYVRAPLVTVDNCSDLEYGVIAGAANDYYYGDYTNLTDYVFSWQEG